MDESFSQWRDSTCHTADKSIVILDSDEENSDSFEKDQIFVTESNESNESTSSIDLTSEKYSSSGKLTKKSIKRRIKKHILYSSDNEDASDNDESFESSGGCEENAIDNDVPDDEIRQAMEHPEETGKDVLQNRINDSEINDSNTSNSISNDIDTSNESLKHEKPYCSGNLVAVSLAKQEIGVGNIDPLVAQKRALLVCKMEHLKNQLSKSKLFLANGNINILPDNGKKLLESIAMQEKEIKEIEIELQKTPLTETGKSESYFTKQEPLPIKEFTSMQNESYSDKFNSHSELDHILMQPATLPEGKELGKKAQTRIDNELALTVDRLQDLHGSLVARPSEDEKAEDPQGLKVKLMPHQQHALAWLIWREQQRPPGGVLADDMGLGKTLTMISLIMAKKISEEAEENDDEWIDRNKPSRYKGGTLVVCPASLLSQWEKEINCRCKRGMLSVEVYHGTNRESMPKKLAKNDVVITTYNILSREFKIMSTVYKIYWERVILDEAHVIRNHKSQASLAVCGLTANKRWALTGTPIQNKEMDLYSILKFLKCSPFDDIRVWKRWVDNKNAAGGQRLATVMKTLMLRRTKQELQAKGALESLPEKFIEEIFVKLDSQEQLVYQKVLIYSRTLFAQFLAQRAEKEHMIDLGVGKYNSPSFLSNPNKNTQFTKAQNKLLSLHADIKTHEILVLLLRLRQICVHPSLINSMLDQEDMQESGITDTENLNPDLLLQINNITLQDSDNKEDESEKEIGVDTRVATNVLTSKNPVFDPDRTSSKLKTVFSKIEEILQKNDKMIIVSQWTSMLNIVASCLSSIKGATYSMFTGNVPIKQRQGVMDSFNAPDSDPRILLLSLTAGGVGLNLVGGNHLLLIDIHWNPQLEVQAQDRIYRFGQRKNVFIYKFICKDTIEERIKNLQERKLDIAQNVLSGDKNSAASKLTLNDLKSLFAL
ncbi:unnamed protein product [Xylocopa violacea]|uniref:Transcription termination factor 2 n=1 Tax=Xylocopa violacea TaxID=135666 RepID=A0ABP1NN06_XYLVO